MANPGVIMIDPAGRVSVGPDQIVTPVDPAVTAPGCCDCTSTTTLYAQACPCGTVWTGDDTPNDCMVPDPEADTGACIMVDLRSVLADMPVRLGMRLFGFWVPRAGGGTRYIGPVIKVGEHCYRFVPPANLYAPASSTEAQRASALAALTPPGALDPSAIVDLPAGLAIVGGEGALIPVVAGCGPEHGCGPTVAGPEFREAFACDGQHNGVRWFVCARVASGGQTFGCRCISRGRGYSAAEVAAFQAAAPGLVFVFYDEPAWDLVWAYGPGHPNRRPSQSCCFCLTDPQYGPQTCLSGRRWSNVWGADHWFYTNECCGKLAGFSYRVVLAYRRVITALHQTTGERLTTTITASITSVVRRSDHVIEARGVQVITGTNESGVQYSYSESELVILLNPACCLYPAFDHRQVPTVGYLAQDGSTFVDDWDGTTQPWSQLVVPTQQPGSDAAVGDLAFGLRDAWANSPWAVLQTAAIADGGHYTGTGACFGTCNSASFRLDESITGAFGGRTETCSINLHVEAVYDNSSPCGPNGLCGSSGWASRDITELVP